MGCKNDKELTRKLQNVMEGAMRKAQLKAYDVVKDFMDTYYTEYTPKEYERTYQFYKSLVRSEIKKTRTGFACSIYIDTDSMDYLYHSGSEVMNMINRGFHADASMNKGSYQTPYDIGGTAVWDESLEEIERSKFIINTFAEHFKRNMR